MKFCWVLKQVVKGFFEYVFFFIFFLFRIKILLSPKSVKVLNDKPLSDKADFDSLVDYFYEENKRRRILGGTRVLYTGFRSCNGLDADAIEGCSRFLPLAAIYSETLGDSSAQKNEIRGFIRKAISLGCNPKSIGYWGDPQPYSQLICEMADIALALWLAKEWLWKEFSDGDRRRVLDWLRKGVFQPVVENNWHLFVIQIELVLRSFGEPVDVSQWRIDIVKSFRRSSGWFKDGSDGRIDLYSAWGFNYSFYWMRQIAPEFEKEFIESSITEFGESYVHLINGDGTMPFFGRSVCYRLSLASPLLASSHIDVGGVSRRQAIRALKESWSFFISKGAVEDGRITQGIFGDNESLVDEYSGPASPMWSLRSLIIAYYQEHIGVPTFDVKGGCFPVEISDFDIMLGEDGVRAKGCKHLNEVRIEFPYYTKSECKRSLSSKILRFVFQLKPFRSTKHIDHGRVFVTSSNDYTDEKIE